MKSENKILFAFVLNLCFSVLEFLGGIFTGSAAIMSDAVHDIGDAASIGLSYFFEKKATRQPDNKYTYGYARFSVLGGIITTIILFVGSVVVIINAVYKIVTPSNINYNGMILFGVIGVIVNFLAAYFTHGGDSINQKSVNLHMLEDVLGWLVVLIGAVIMRFTNLRIIDPIMSLGVAVFILINTIKNLRDVLDIFLEKTPNNISVEQIIEHLCAIDGVIEVHHVHLRTLDGHNVYATMHIVTDSDFHEIKENARKELCKHGITHSTLELERSYEECHHKHCYIEYSNEHHCRHHH